MFSQGTAFLRQVPIAYGSRLGEYRLAQAKPVEYPCPVGGVTREAPPGEQAFVNTYDPNLNCMRDARGNAVCSDGVHYPPGCPKTPPAEYFTSGITPDITTGNQIEGQIPPPRSASNGVGSSGSFPLLPVVGVLGVGALAVLLLA